MNARERAAAQIAAAVPSDLRVLRAKLMLEPLCEALGVEETACPLCGGSGWVEREALRRCPLCLGFREVPVPLADWFDARLLAGGTPAGCGPGVRERAGPGGPKVYRVLLPGGERAGG
ncbi:MAG: hypothetical protein GXY85_07325 [Candidatus Brocadiaceae bacterium]|nr:hypothetical protein [Candidatus Brocadiaceae bacterium]